jgi:hypothetical protein
METDGYIIVHLDKPPLSWAEDIRYSIRKLKPGGAEDDPTHYYYDAEFKTPM